MSGTDRSRAGHLSGLDGARAVAAYGVIATHVGFNTGRSLDHSALAAVLARLDFGVTIFFLLSGFLLFRPFAASGIAGRRPPRVGSFWWRRALRILPAYLIVVTVTLGVLSHRPASGSDWWSYLLLVQTYNGHDVDSSLGQMWTLVVEIGFYAVLPLLAALPRRRPARATPLRRHVTLLVAMALVALASNVLSHQLSGAGRAQLWLPTYFDWFALGMFLAVASCVPADAARWRRTLRDWAASPGTCWAAGIMLFWLATLPLAGPQNLAPASSWEWTIKHYLYGAAAFLFLLPVVLGGERGWTQQVLGNRVMRRLGEISYGVYLWHLPLLIFLQRALGWRVFGGHFASLFLLTALASTAAAALSYYLIERPLLRRYSRPWRRGGQQRSDEARDADQAQRLDPAGAGQRSD